MKRTNWWGIPAAVVLIAVVLVPAAAASARTGTASGLAPIELFAAAPNLARLHAAISEERSDPEAKGESPPGRVTQVPGYAGYQVPDGATTSDSETVTLPTIACNTGSDPSFGDVNSSEPVPGVLIEAGSSLVETQVFWNCRDNEYASWSTLDPSCSEEGCPLSGWANGIVSPGDVVDIQASTSPSGSSTTITDLTSGASAAYTAAGTTATSTSVIFSLLDYCFLPGGAGTIGETCNADDSSSPIPPPGYGNFTPVDYSSVEVDGTGLGSYLSGPDSAGWTQDNSVWGSTLVSETSYVGGGSSFTITNPETTLPSLTVSDPSIDKPATGSANLAFVVSLSFASSNPIYVDYSTQDVTAHAGQDYQAESGTLKLPAGSLTKTIDVPAISGPQSGQNGNQVLFYLNITNPSYVAGGGLGEGTIYEGPIVTAVSPAAVPLNGGPATTINVTGVDFGSPGSADSVQFCPTAAAGGGNCLAGSGAVVDSDTSITVAAPDASSAVLDQATTLQTDTIVTDTSGINSPVNGNDVLVFGCTTQAATDGSFQAFGCLTDETGGNDVTQSESQVDGVDVSATTSDPVTYATSSGGVTSSGSGSVTVSLPVLGNKAVQIFSGVLSKSLSAPVTFAVPPNTTLAGLAISGSLTLTPGSLGQASGSVTVTLPDVLGGGTGTLTFMTATGQGLTNLSIQVPKANFMQLFALTNVNLTFAAPGTWSVSGTASTGGTTSTTFSGKLVYAAGKLTSASLDVGAISLAGLLNLSDLSVSFAAGAWSGKGTVTQTSSSGTEKATVSLAFSGGALTSAEIKTGAVTLFGVINLKSFDMKYSGSGWNLAVTSDAPGGGTDSASLAVSGGVISSASLTLTNMTFLKTVTINTATISYAASQPNQACNTVTGTEIWCGSWQISFPKATSVSGVSGSLAFQAGQFASGAVSVSGNVALLDGVFLTQLGATLTINPAPTTVAGSATISFGPQVAGVSALSLQGTLTRAFPTAKSGGFYDLQGNLTALAGSSHALLLGSGEVKVEDTGKATVSLTLGGGPGGLSVTVGSATASIAGMLTGTFTSSTFSLTGTTMITVPVLGTFSGSLKADNNGIASCAKVPGGKQVGFEYFWSNGATQVFDTKGCTEAGF